MSIRFLNIKPTNLCVKYFSSSCITHQSHYDSLEISKNATQSDVKSAYYRLSKLYHPDKNKGCTESSKKFQQVSSAYEVLGNFKLRKLYDKGLLSSGQSLEHPVEYPEHPEAQFYKSRDTRTKVSNAQTVYDFDEWSRAHYGETFQRGVRARERLYKKQTIAKQTALDIKSEKVIFSIIAFMFLFTCFSFMKDDLDEVKTK